MLVRAEFERAPARFVNFIQQSVPEFFFDLLKRIERLAHRQTDEFHAPVFDIQTEITATDAVQVFVESVFPLGKKQLAGKIPAFSLRADAQIGKMLSPAYDPAAGPVRPDAEGKIAARFLFEVRDEKNPVPALRFCGKTDGTARARRLYSVLPRHLGKAQRGHPGVLHLSGSRSPDTVLKDALRDDFPRQRRGDPQSFDRSFFVGKFV